jgi:hypothetical protein
MTPVNQATVDAIRDGVTRTVGVVGLAGLALIHLLDTPDTMSSTPYKGWMYIGLIISAMALAGALTRTSHTLAWQATAALALTALVGYIVSRTIGLPGAADDIGNWAEPLGISSLFVEASLIALSASVVLSRRVATVRVRRPAARLATDF